MKYEFIEKKELSKVKIDVIFTKEEYEAAFNEALKKLAAKVEIKGFRKGKAPVSLYRKNYGDQSATEETVSNLINDSYGKIITEAKINVVGQPSISLKDDINDNEWGYSAIVSVYPEVELVNYQDLGINFEETEVTEELVINYINEELKKHAELEILEDAQLENGHIAIFDFCGYVDGEKFEGGEAFNHELEIGSNQFIPGFEEQMIGMKTGDIKRINVKFPENYAKELASKDAEFEIKLHEIKKQVLPSLDEDFLSEIKFEGSLSDYKNSIKEKLVKDHKKEDEEKYTNDTYKKLIDLNPIVIPEEFIDNALNQEVKKVEEAASKYGLDVETLLKIQGIESLDKYKELCKPRAINNVHLELLIDEIIKKENFQITEEEFQKFYEENKDELTAEEYKKGVSKDRLEYYLKRIRVEDLLLKKS